MDVLWQDSVGSFLDSLVADTGACCVSFAGRDGAAPWSAAADSSPFAGSDSLLWSGNNETPADTSLAYAGSLGPDGNTPFGSDPALLAAGLLWGDSGSNTSIWPINDPWLATGISAQGTDTFPLIMSASGSGAPSLLWQTAVSSFEQVSTEVQSIAGNSVLSQPVDSQLNQVLGVLGNVTGGSGQPPTTLPVTALATNLPGSGGLPASSFSMLAPQQLLWTAPSGAVSELSGSSAMSTSGSASPGVSSTPNALTSSNLVFPTHT